MLPLQPSVSGPASAPGVTKPDAGADTACILVVDDRPENLLVSRTILEELGQPVITAQSGEEALKRVLENDFALILLDVNMPGMDGLETATFIRGRQKTAHTPIIFLTAYIEEMHTAKGYSLGAVDYILTPVMPNILRTKAKVFVELYLMTRQARRQAEERIALEREQLARAAAESEMRRSAFIGQASHILSESLDVATTVKALSKFLVPFLADLSILSLCDAEARATRSEIAWAGSSASLARLDNPAIDQAMQEALASGAIVELELTPGYAVLSGKLPGQDEPATFDLEFEVRALAAVPLIARGRKLGALVLGYAHRRLDAASRALAQDIATRAAVSLDNCLLYATIQEADQRKNEFLAMLAHELRNPLAPLRNSVQILRMAGSDKGRLEWATDVIDRQTQQLVRLVDDLLDVARITQGKIALKMETVDVAAVMAFAMEMNRPLTDAQKHELFVTPPSESLFVHGDYSRIAQILSNLVNNAAKYTPPGGKIWFSAESQGADVVFRVKDSGVGIAADMIGSIFDLFTQADRSLDRPQGGLGIGLTIVHRLVAMQGGSVQAFSGGAGTGSKFVVRLPLAEPVPASRSPERRALGQDAVQRVLVVDDYVDAAESMAALLKLDGHDVRTVHDGHSALELARRFKPAVVFLDIGLPVMNGFELATALRATRETKDCLLIAVSGYGQADDHRKSKKAGFDMHLVKPVDLSALRDIFDSVK